MPIITLTERQESGIENIISVIQGILHIIVGLSLMLAAAGLGIVALYFLPFAAVGIVAVLLAVLVLILGCFLVIRNQTAKLIAGGLASLSILSAFITFAAGGGFSLWTLWYIIVAWFLLWNKII